MPLHCRRTDLCWPSLVHASSFRFGPFTVDAGSYRLFRGTEVIPLSPKIIDLLLYLVARQSALVPKDELFTALWPDVAVTDNALTQAVSELRQALGDDASTPTYIQTVARRGYRFIAPSKPPPPAQPSPHRRADAIAVVRRTASHRRDGFREREHATASSPGSRPGSPRRSRTISVRRAPAASSIASGWLKPCAVQAPTCQPFARSSISISPSSAVSSAPAIACGSRRGSSTRDRARRWPRPRRMARSSRSSNCRIGSSRSSPRRSGPPGWAAPGGARTRKRAASRLTRRSPKDASGSNRSTRRSCRRDRGFRAGDLARSPVCAAHVGSANARFWQYEMSRARNQPDGALLARAIDHVRRAIELERDLAEAHATLSFLLVSAGRFSEALAAARRAVTLEPGYWGNQFRLAHAAVGQRATAGAGAGDGPVSGLPVRSLRGRDGAHRAREPRPRGVRPARGHDRPGSAGAPASQRYPAKGLHWLLGLVRLARGRRRRGTRGVRSRDSCRHRRSSTPPEFAMNAYDGAGFAALADG